VVERMAGRRAAKGGIGHSATKKHIRHKRFFTSEFVFYAFSWPILLRELTRPMPRACPVEFYVWRYNAGTGIFQMPRACLVEFHVQWLFS
jgi:hypothetical protein